MLKVSFFLVLTLPLMLFACENSSEKVSEKTIDMREIPIVIQEGKVTNHIGNIMVKKEENIRLIFSSDESVTVHLHGYDIEKQIKGDDPAVMEFLAKATGRFVITSHPSHDMHTDSSVHGTLVSLEIRP